MKMKMKSLALATAMGLGVVGTAHAYTLGTFDRGVLVPWALVDGAVDTAVGLINACNRPINVYWTFWDEDSNHILDGVFTMTENDMYSFIWSNELGFGLEGMLGYLTFTPSDRINPVTGLPIINDSCLAGSAFALSIIDGDVAYIPTVPLANRDFYAVTPPRNNDPNDPNSLFNEDGNSFELPFLQNESIVRLTAGAPEGANVFMRYFIDGVIGNDVGTNILVWSPGTNQAWINWYNAGFPTPAPAGIRDSVAGTYTTFMYDDNQDRRSVNFSLPNAELNSIDPEQDILGRPATFLDGYIRWNNVPTDVFSFSVMFDGPTFNATQTILNPHS